MSNLMLYEYVVQPEPMGGPANRQSRIRYFTLDIKSRQHFKAQRKIWNFYLIFSTRRAKHISYWRTARTPISNDNGLKTVCLYTCAPAPPLSFLLYLSLKTLIGCIHCHLKSVFALAARSFTKRVLFHGRRNLNENFILQILF